MFGNSWKIGRIAGVDLRVDVSWTIIALLIGYTFFIRFEALHPDLGWGENTGLAAGSAVVFFGSVLVHELAHALVAKARGIPVKSITLFLFGGATEAKVESRAARDEFLISVVGPITSFVVAAALWGLAVATGAAADPVAGALGYLAWVNVALGVFNLLPGLPLDGGRVLRSAIWGATGRMGHATRIAARGGQFIGYGLVALGVLSLLTGSVGGLWLAAIGWFLAQAAQASYVQEHVGRVLRGVDVEDVMTRELITIPATIDVETAVDRWFLRHDHSAYPVTASRDGGDGGAVVGVLPLRAVRRVPREERAHRSVESVMIPIDDVPSVSLDASLHAVVECFEQDDTQRVVVRRPDGSVAGLITPRDVSRWLQRTEELGTKDLDLTRTG